MPTECWYCSRHPCDVVLGVRHCPCVCHLGGDPGPDPSLVADVPMRGFYYATDLGLFFVDNGTAWVQTEQVGEDAC